MPALWIWKNDRQQKNAVVYENYDGKNIRHVSGLRRQNLIGLLAKLACVSLLTSKKDVWEENMLFIPFLKIDSMT